MMEFINNLEYWHWLVLALVLIIIEMIAPSAIFLWFGIAAGIVGVLLLFMSGMAWQIQFVLFSLLSITTILAWKAYVKKHPAEEDKTYSTLNKRGDDLIDRVFTLEENIINNYGKIRVDDTMWKIRCDSDMNVGGRVKVIRVDGTVLVVEPQD
jgi:membrane protein implicated in regulation of membrane protease activity